MKHKIATTLIAIVLTGNAFADDWGYRVFYQVRGEPRVDPPHHRVISRPKEDAQRKL